MSKFRKVKCFTFIAFALITSSCKEYDAQFQDYLKKSLGVNNKSINAKAKLIEPTKEDILTQQNSIRSCPENAFLVGKAHPNGKAQWCAYKDSSGNEVKHGEFRSWHQNGVIKEQAYYEDGELSGDFKEWYQEKKIKEITKYTKGLKNGRSTIYSKDGLIVEDCSYVSDFKEGLCVKNGVNGRSVEKGYYKNGQKNGLWEFYDQNGQVKERTEYLNNMKHGRTNKFTRNGNLNCTGFYSKNEEIGHWTFFNFNGQKTTEGNMFAGKKHGKWVDYYLNGQSARINYFDNGRRVESYKAEDYSANGGNFGNKDILGSEPPRQKRQNYNSVTRSEESEKSGDLEQKGWSAM